MTRQTWAGSFGKGQELWKLREHGAVAEFLSKDKPDNNPHGRLPVYHVWEGDRWVYCGQSAEASNREYLDAIKRANEKIQH